MIKSILNWLRGVEHTVEDIVSDFNNTVVRLEQRASDMLEAVNTHLDAAAEHKELAEIKTAEMEKASAVAAKIKELVG